MSVFASHELGSVLFKMVSGQLTPGKLSPVMVRINFRVGGQCSSEAIVLEPCKKITSPNKILWLLITFYEVIYLD